MLIDWRMKTFCFVYMNLLCFTNCNLTTETILSEKNTSTLNSETFSYNATDGEHNCDSMYGDENGGCAFEATVNITDDKDTSNSIAVTPVSIPLSMYVNETSTEASSVTDGIKYLKNSSDVSMTINVTDLTSTFIPTTESSVTNYTLLASVHDCDCDMLKNECDINCCCDKDCTAVEKQVFAYCSPLKSSDALFRSSSVDNHHCYTSRFIYRNNTKLLEPVEHRSSNLFCIAVDNLSPKLVYKEYPLIKSIDHFNRMLRRFRKRVYNWTRGNHSQVEECDMNLNTSRTNGWLKYGSCILIVKNNSSILKQFSLPVASSSISPFCNKLQTAFYLQDSSTDCLRRSPKNQKECESLMDYLDLNNYINFRVLATSHPVNVSYSHSDCPEEICIDVNVSVNPSNITLRPTYNSTNGECVNVVDKVYYSIYHNGSQGIIQFNVDFHLTNLQSKSGTHGNGFFRQYFHIKYHHSVNDSRPTNSTVIKLVRSGTPGYITGRPVICGKKVVTKSDNELSGEILLRANQKSWLTMPKSSALTAGHCDRSERLNVLFLQNIKSECFLNVSIDCYSIRNQTLEMLFGENSINMTDVRESNIYVSKYGDPNVEDLNEWVPVLTDVNTVKNDVSFKCAEVFTNIDYKVIYSYTKNIKRPQAAIIGVMMTLSKPKDSIVLSEHHHKTFRIRSSVSFVDVTRLDSVITKFADPPVYEIKLPADFFYPFLSRSHKMSPSVFCLIGFMILCFYT